MRCIGHKIFTNLFSVVLGCYIPQKDTHGALGMGRWQRACVDEPCAFSTLFQRCCRGFPIAENHLLYDGFIFCQGFKNRFGHSGSHSACLYVVSHTTLARKEPFSSGIGIGDHPFRIEQKADVVKSIKDCVVGVYDLSKSLGWGLFDARLFQHSPVFFSSKLSCRDDEQGCQNKRENN